MRRPTVRSLRLAVLGVAGTLALSGCGGLFGDGVYDVALPGGADLGDHPITISADFSDALDLVPQSSVKVDNVAVGRVSEITLNEDGHSARVVLEVNGDVDLPVGTQARLQQTALLGEKYVALVRPEGGARTGARLGDGAELGLADTSRAAEVEEVLGALSLLLNGGGIQQFQEISRELQQVSDGRPGQIKGFLRQMQTFATQLDRNKTAITTAIDNLGALSATLEDDKDTIAKALQELSPGMQVIVDQREDLVAMLKALDRLSKVTVDTLDQAQDDLVSDLRSLAPILRQLARSGSDLPEALQILLTYPFPDSVLGAIKGDYLNVFITTNFRTVPADCEETGCPWPQVSGRAPVSTGLNTGPDTGPDTGPGTGTPPPTLLPPTSSPVPGLPTPTVSVPTPTTPASPSGSPSAPPPGSTPTSPAPPTGSTPPSPTGAPTDDGTSSDSPLPEATGGSPVGSAGRTGAGRVPRGRGE